MSKRYAIEVKKGSHWLKYGKCTELDRKTDLRETAQDIEDNPSFFSSSHSSPVTPVRVMAGERAMDLDISATETTEIILVLDKSVTDDDFPTLFSSPSVVQAILLHDTDGNEITVVVADGSLTTGRKAAFFTVDGAALASSREAKALKSAGIDAISLPVCFNLQSDLQDGCGDEIHTALISQTHAHVEERQQQQQQQHDQHDHDHDHDHTDAGTSAIIDIGPMAHRGPHLAAASNIVVAL